MVHLGITKNVLHSKCDVSITIRNPKTWFYFYHSLSTVFK